ncbi:hypothetical protein [Flavihumibacter petaseus]|uniref:ABM domain-containing protein n=1 Tax=Flavihumibacter petaseus NBRC 106054 TaxID=1220578 RepID=A0A0E9MYZ9_9BACT|nr:hypothetical protein [Flavihumibacter petaseus]GAO42758.1 hypothetical protein FPE01S_01_17760 [Flavihumibacter petaseus NBRC 106054]
MITVKVSYTVDQAFVEENQHNISVFMEDFRKVSSAEFRYDVYLLEDGVTFLHLSHYLNESVQKQVLAIPSFKVFQEKRDASGIGNSHKLEVMKFVGTTDDLFFSQR